MNYMEVNVLSSNYAKGNNFNNLYGMTFHSPI